MLMHMVRVPRPGQPPSSSEGPPSLASSPYKPSMDKAGSWLPRRTDRGLDPSCPELSLLSPPSWTVTSPSGLRFQ